jgi:recombination protein RecR
MERLVSALSELPGLGPRSAQRIAFHILSSSEAEVETLMKALGDFKARIRFCSSCGNLTAHDPCPVCRDPSRDRTLICVVEEPKDVLALEATGSYRGLYHVIMGKIAPLDGVNPEDLRIQELMDRVRKTKPGEVIIATGSDADGETTALYLARVLKPLAAKVTRIAAGVPVGSSLDFVDPATLTKALEGRRDVA